MPRVIGSRLASRRCVSLTGIALLGAVTALSVPVGAKGIPCIQDLETEKKKGWVLGLVVLVGESHVLSIEAVSPSARGKRHDLAVRRERLSAATRERLQAAGYTRSRPQTGWALMVSPPSEWETYFSGAYAGVLFDALPPGEYSLGEYRIVGVPEARTTRTLTVPLERAADTFTVRPGEVVYVGSFGLSESSPFLHSVSSVFMLPAGAEQLGSEVTVHRKDDLPTVLAVLEEVESGLGAAVRPRVVEAPHLREAKAKAIQRLKALADRREDLKRQQEDLKRRHEQGLLTSVELLKELLDLARDVATTRSARPGYPEEEELTPLFEKVKSPDTPIMVQKVVADIDELVFTARQARRLWEKTFVDDGIESEEFDEMMKDALRATLRKHKLDQDTELFNRAHRYIGVYY